MNYRPGVLRWLYWQNVDVDQSLKVQRMHFGKRKPYNYRIIDVAFCLKLTHQLNIFVIKGEKLQIQVLSYEQPICDLRHPKCLEKFRSAPLATENLCELANTQADVPYIMWKMAYLCTASVSQVAHLSSSRSVVPVGGDYFVPAKFSHCPVLVQGHVSCL